MFIRICKACFRVSEFMNIKPGLELHPIHPVKTYITHED
jgi:hypothetical protein